MSKIKVCLPIIKATKMNFEKLSTCEAIADKFSKTTICICNQYYQLKIFFKFVHSRLFCACS